jgi:hypothetical protein
LLILNPKNVPSPALPRPSTASSRVALAPTGDSYRSSHLYYFASDFVFVQQGCTLLQSAPSVRPDAHPLDINGFLNGTLQTDSFIFHYERMFLRTHNTTATCTAQMSDEDSRRKLRIPYLLNQPRADAPPGTESSTRQHHGSPLPPPHPGRSSGHGPSAGTAPQHPSFHPMSRHGGTSGSGSSSGAAPSPAAVPTSSSSSHHRGSGRSHSSHARGGASASQQSAHAPSRHKHADPAHEGTDPDADKRRCVCDRPNCGYRFKQRGGEYICSQGL